MKIKHLQSVLLVIDVQEKLLPAIDQHEVVLETSLWAVDLANSMGIPVVVTEHCPDKIGGTVPVLRDKLQESQRISKTYFSAVTEGNLLSKIPTDKKQIIVVGTEAHVCVLQTVLDLVEENYQVFVLEPGIGSRNSQDKYLAVERMRQNDVEIITKEMLAFEWLERAGTAVFKEVLRKFIK